MVHEIWNWRLLNKAREYYQENFAFVGPSGRAFTGVNDFQTYVLALLSPFPDLAISIDHFLHCIGDERAGYRTAIRWTMRGTHTGYGVYGEPTGNPIRIIGISHHSHQRRTLIENEWSIFDEFCSAEADCSRLAIQSEDLKCRESYVKLASKSFSSTDLGCGAGCDKLEPAQPELNAFRWGGTGTKKS